MSKKNEVFISVDIETSGPIVGEHSMLTLGACLAYQPEVSFSVMLKPISNESVADALEVTGLTMAEAEKKGCRQLKPCHSLLHGSPITYLKIAQQCL